jgi:hypothetical protein
MKKVGIVLFSVLLLFGLFQAQARAEEETPPQEQQDCLAEEEYTRYSFATPDELMPDVEETVASIVWNYQCAHENNRLEVQDSSGQVVKVIQSGSPAGKGENRESWDGRDENGQPVPDGVYTVVITPLDEYAEFAMRVNVKIRLFKYPSIYGIFGDELKEKVKNLP